MNRTLETLRAASSGPAHGAPMPARPVQTGTEGGPAHRILVVDDNADAAMSLAMLLELEGHTTRVAHSGMEALAAVPEFMPQIVLLDIGLPDLSGYEVARRLRAMPGLPHQPRLIALTGWGQDEDRARSREAGFDVHLVKPVDPADLGAAIG